ncbi:MULTISPECIES: carbohydrate kinase family protein [Bradyrhizobium]|jgi:hypothetical protein|uniref:carbohydrate kinase family protein n=1 Tax=Bradyrhizobium TaxID=374 RepID=UPI000464931F|nr:MULTISPECIES: carbohydrate kinase family protein [Bradyrhizobium]KIU52076.1 hypothetical protein QU41_03565 [Bradyrhizobium elkanii]OCX29105.1 hypothetical protein QU42_19405 [Bradyrhizobium sp. UASWS1016]
MIVVGGTYLEECDWPAWRQLMGPGVRAALALSRLSPGSELFTYVERDARADLVETMSQIGVKASTRDRRSPINFYYKHPLTSPHLEPKAPAHEGQPWNVSGKVVLAFPMFESQIMVSADRAIFEIAHNGDSVARDNNIVRGEVESLALIAAEDEIPAPTGDFRDTAAELMAAHSADLMIVRKRSGGGILFDGEVQHEIPAYVAGEWFKIGAGNVFCTIFAHYWGEKALDPVQAADLASRASAVYAGAPAGALPFSADSLSSEMEQFDPSAPCKVFVASPCQSMAQQWLLDQALRALWALKVDTVSPYDLGLDGSPRKEGDIGDQLDDCNAILVLAEGADIASVLAVGLARVRSLPMVVLEEEVRASRLALWQDTGCEIARDLASAVYRSMVAGRRRTGR